MSYTDDLLWDFEGVPLKRGQTLWIDSENGNDPVCVRIEDFIEGDTGSEPLFVIEDCTLTMSDMHRVTRVLQNYINPNVTMRRVAEAQRGGRILDRHPYTKEDEG